MVAHIKILKSRTGNLLLNSKMQAISRVSKSAVQILVLSLTRCALSKQYNLFVLQFFCINNEDTNGITLWGYLWNKLTII